MEVFMVDALELAEGHCSPEIWGQTLSNFLSKYLAIATEYINDTFYETFHLQFCYNSVSSTEFRVDGLTELKISIFMHTCARGV